MGVQGQGQDTAAVKWQKTSQQGSYMAFSAIGGFGAQPAEGGYMFGVPGPVGRFGAQKTVASGAAPAFGAPAAGGFSAAASAASFAAGVGASATNGFGGFGSTTGAAAGGFGANTGRAFGAAAAETFCDATNAFDGEAFGQNTSCPPPAVCRVLSLMSSKSLRRFEACVGQPAGGAFGQSGA